MSFVEIRRMESADTIKSEFPVGQKETELIQKHRREIADILSGRDNRMLLIAGPCSAFPYDSVVKTAQYLAELQNRVSDKIKIVMRCYTQKPRTNGGTWEGPAMQPDPYLLPDFEAGIEYTRHLFQEITIKTGLAIADEAVFVGNAGFVDDLLSYVAIGARSSEDPSHRKHASMLDLPVGVKNTPDADVDISLNSVRAAQLPAHAYMDGMQILTSGNQYAHLILRGSRGTPNISASDLQKVTSAIKARYDAGKLTNPALIIDVSHDNCINPLTGKKDYLLQPELLAQVLSMRKEIPLLRQYLRGFMTENFLRDGAQKLDDIVTAGGILQMDGLSCTDACLGLEKTTKMVLDMYKLL